MKPKQASGAGLAVLVVAAILLFAQAHGSDPREPRSERPAPSGPASSTPAPDETATAPPELPPGYGSVLAVKLDNARAARPHTGLAEADIVYVERVESGISRFLAIFASTFPDAIGPVRSARETDLELLAQYENPVLAYSGAQSKLEPHIESAPLRPFPPEELPGGYFRGGTRPAPHNLYLRPDSLMRANPDLVPTRGSLGFETGPAPAGGTPVTERSARLPNARFSFTWSGSQERWLVTMDGAPGMTAAGKRLAPATVILQEVTIRQGSFGDRWGNNSPFTETVGSGRATVLRDGEAHSVEWQRPTAADRTEFTTATGGPMTFAEGQIWVVYVPRR